MHNEYINDVFILISARRTPLH